MIKIGIVGSRRRNTHEDYNLLYKEFCKLVHLFLKIGEIKYMDQIEIVTGDCDEGGDKFAKYLVEEFGCKLDEKKIKDPETGEEMDFNNHRWFHYLGMVQIFYDRNEEIAKEPLDYLIALVHHSRIGGTENTIKHFKRYHKDWEKKLIIL